MCWCFIHYWIEKCTVKQWRTTTCSFPYHTERRIQFWMLMGSVTLRPIFSPVTWYKFWRALAHFPRDIRSLFPDHGSNSLWNIGNYTQIHTGSFPQKRKPSHCNTGHTSNVNISGAHTACFELYFLLRLLHLYHNIMF